MIKDEDIDFKCLFSFAFSTVCNYSNVTDKDMAEKFGVSKSTVKRWRTGVNLPNPAILETVCSWIDEQLKLFVEKHSGK